MYAQPEQRYGDQAENTSSQFPPARPIGAGLFLPLDVGMDNHQQRSPCQTVSIVDLAANMRANGNRFFAEALRPVERVEHNARGAGVRGKGLAVGPKRSGGGPMLQKDSALRGTNEVDPIGRFALRVEESDLGAAVHILMIRRS